jgi:hypothetical protein
LARNLCACPFPILAAMNTSEITDAQTMLWFQS